MKKKSLALIGIIVLSSSIFTACSSKKDDVSIAIEVARSYKMNELEANKPDNTREVTPQQIAEKEEAIKPLTTESYFNKQSASRGFVRGSRIALIKKTALKLENLSFTEKVDTGQSIDLSYTGELVFGEDMISLDGIVTLLKKGDTWKVNNDIYNSEDIMAIINTEIENSLSDNNGKN
ncbi:MULTISPECIES: hypothetical protein [Paenibacillus]|uniref:Lipoprotein n=1 Tax=Paenibacillus helianthi TaxID=1349432 RepID=A0ABX3EKE6_9BACL|nr:MULTISPECIES: hypothetical protein [Paenibacillus]OKP84904.1 hypothetical protein A3844_18330 [Paenibacillus helianthi]OKP86418.1 hypothetical protein A3848_21500 [Paenibacillus sp. P32E]OKP88656.1 hypothetical protein A3842_05410 [Paenibacillus sp. P3E]OKP96764.1 hypothetical protein A3849_19445 [Paenibacillus sp. P46E]